MTGAHSLLAPSSAGRWVNCPGSVLLGKQCPEDPNEGRDGEEGTEAHAYATALLTGKAPPGGVATNQDMAEAVQTYVDHVRGLPGAHFVEKQVRAPGIHAELWGTCDFFSIDRPARVAYLRDFKYGWGPIAVYENWQLLSYLAAVCGELGDVTDWTFDLGIVQPRPWHPDGPVRTWRVSGPEASGYLRHLRVAAEAAMGNNPDTVAGQWCDHCPASHSCRALHATTLDILDRVSDATPIELPPEALGRELALLTRAEAFIEARKAGLSAQAEALLRGGVDVAGWTLEAAPGREKWTGDFAAVIATGLLLGVDLARPPEPITPNQARKAGLDPALIKGLSIRTPGERKLKPVDPNRAKLAFGGSTLTQKDV